LFHAAQGHAPAMCFERAASAATVPQKMKKAHRGAYFMGVVCA
jgi:hypothetical protein